MVRPRTTSVELLNPSYGLYLDPKTGKRISTNSMLKTFKHCPKEAEYKYVHRLKPRLLGGPLKRGVWVHELLEDLHNGIDWRIRHAKLSAKFAEMLDEEKDYYGNMPVEIAGIMECYEWHYQLDPWIVIDTEFQLDAELPDGTILRGKVDGLVENSLGLWLVDHKTHRSIPDLRYRMLDAQSAFYIWLALKNKIKVQGFIWNYVRWKMPSTPELLKNGSRLSKTACDTDYVTLKRALETYERERGYKPSKEDLAWLNRLKGLQYRPGMPQESTFFRREVIEKDTDMLKRVILGNYTTSKRMHSYDFTNPDKVERNVDRGCSYCSYADVCTAELMGVNTLPIIKQNFIVGDPNDYYNDRAGDTPDKD